MTSTPAEFKALFSYLAIESPHLDAIVNGLKTSWYYIIAVTTAHADSILSGLSQQA